MKISAGKIILLTLHIAFLLPVFWEDGIIGILATIAVFIALIFGNFSSKTVISNTNSFLPLLVVIGGTSTYFLSIQLGLGSVIAASIVGLIASFIPDITKKSWTNSIPAPVYTGAFVGMSAIYVAPNYLFILLASMMSGGIYMIVKNDLNGFGGKLGTIAFGGVSFLTLLIYFMK